MDVMSREGSTVLYAPLSMDLRDREHCCEVAQGCCQAVVDPLIKLGPSWNREMRTET